jgi:hypothetical protein
MCDLTGYDESGALLVPETVTLPQFHVFLFHPSVTTDLFAAQHFVPRHGCAGRIVDCHAKVFVLSGRMPPSA